MTPQVRPGVLDCSLVSQQKGVIVNDMITRVTNPGFRKYVYRVAWAAALVLVSSGRLDATQLEVVLGLVAAVLAVADSQTPTNSSSSSAEEAWADGVIAGMGIADRESDTSGWQASAGNDWVPPEG